ncbi:GntR family transcriptional regulator, partial [Pseudomonas fluorescens]
SEAVGTELRGAARQRINMQDTQRSDAVPGAGLSRRGRMMFDTGGVTDQQAVKAFATGLPETRTFPVDIWERLQRQAMKDYRG